MVRLGNNALQNNFMNMKCTEVEQLTILGGIARSAARPILVRLNTMFFRTFSFRRIMAFWPS
jgi:hypothetical protein